MARAVIEPCEEGYSPFPGNGKPPQPGMVVPSLGLLSPRPPSPDSGGDAFASRRQPANGRPFAWPSKAHHASTDADRRVLPVAADAGARSRFGDLPTVDRRLPRDRKLRASRAWRSATSWTPTDGRLPRMPSSSCPSSSRTRSSTALGQIALTLWLADGRIHGEVSDAGPEPRHTPKRPRPNAVGGRGLVIVDALSDRWGAAETTSRVWFEIAHQPGRALSTPSGGALTIPWMIGAALICSDEACAETGSSSWAKSSCLHPLRWLRLHRDGAGRLGTDEARLVGRPRTSFASCLSGMRGPTVSHGRNS